jgi:hypothetical protein
MANKKQYYGLDEIGFVGTQEKRTNAQVKKDIERTIQYIKGKKASKVISTKKRTRQLAKTK